MKKTTLYFYMGTNGTILSPVHLEDIYYTNRYTLEADKGKILTDGYRRTRCVTVPEEELENWKEVKE